MPPFEQAVSPLVFCCQRRNENQFCIQADIRQFNPGQSENLLRTLHTAKPNQFAAVDWKNTFSTAQSQLALKVILVP